MKHVICIVGARPNFMKMAPILRALNAPSLSHTLKVTLVHTGQHYDEAMQGQFFRELGLPCPDIDLEVGSGSHAQQTALVMSRFEPVLLEAGADLVVVVGDVNSTLACALVAAKCQVPVAHVEAGLRSGDWSMPEEINRVVTDRLSQLLFTTEASGRQNLLAEGIAAERIHEAGNVMIDNLAYQLPFAPPLAQVLTSYDVPPGVTGHFGVVTLHRPSNVDSPEVLTSLVGTLTAISPQLPLLFPVHPRTDAKLDEAGLKPRLQDAGIYCLPPLGYRQLLSLVQSAELVLTDSGGLQEETSYLGVPCLTLRSNTERPVTLTQGSNRLVGCSHERIMQGVQEVLEGTFPVTPPPPSWDGDAASRIAQQIAAFLTLEPQHVPAHVPGPQSVAPQKTT